MTTAANAIPTTAAPAATPAKIRPRERDALLQSLRAGVVPRSGQQHIQVGRRREIEALVQDVDRIGDGGSAVRFVIGEYGSGKTFFLHLVRSVALEKKLVTVHADLTPDRRLHASGGQARSLYAELMRSLATRSAPEGGALPAVVERFVATALEDARARNMSPDAAIRERLASLSEMVGGYDFAQVIAAYWQGHEEHNETLQQNAVRWLRGEFTTKTDARNALGVRTIVDDANVYDHLKLMARFVRLAGYTGLLVCLDELVNLYKLPHAQARNSNYEQILRILNDCLQGTAVGCGFVFGGTPEFLLDPRRGLFSYPALASRLEENRFAQNGLVDYSGPVIRLASLTPEDLYVLLTKLRHVFAAGETARHLLPDDALAAFLTHAARRVGDSYFRTPRTTIRAFVDLLAILEQNPEVEWTDLIERTEIAPDISPDPLSPSDKSASNDGAPPPADEDDDDELASLRLG